MLWYAIVKFVILPFLFIVVPIIIASVAVVAFMDPNKENLETGKERENKKTPKQ